jgi:hypothetical protein
MKELVLLISLEAYVYSFIYNQYTRPAIDSLHVHTTTSSTTCMHASMYTSRVKGLTISIDASL